MHSYYIFLALDVAQERSREAEHLYDLRRAAGQERESRAAALRRWIASVFGRSVDIGTEGRVPAGQPQH